MTKIRYKNESSTFSNVFTPSAFSNTFMAGFIAIQLANPMAAQAANDNGSKHFLQQTYYSEGNRPTFNNSSNPITGVYNLTYNGFEKSVSDFYARLLTSQEPLGVEYEKVLYDNLWDLYES